MARGALVALWCSALVGPALFARDLQTFPTRGGYASYDRFNAVNLCLVRASQYIRDHSDVGTASRGVTSEGRCIQALRVLNRCEGATRCDWRGGSECERYSGEEAA
jgi:hypothetical protein